LWLFDVYANEVSEQSEIIEIEIYPNPVSDYIDLSAFVFKSVDTIEVVDMSGTSVMKKMKLERNGLNVTDLTPGNYILTLHADEKVYQGKFVKL
jgi:hypothetical protein